MLPGSPDLTFLAGVARRCADVGLLARIAGEVVPAPDAVVRVGEDAVAAGVAHEAVVPLPGAAPVRDRVLGEIADDLRGSAPARRPSGEDDGDDEGDERARQGQIKPTQAYRSPS